MKPVTLYNRNVDPYTVTSQEALDYHLLQGWVTDPADLVEPTEIIQPVVPFIVNRPAAEATAPPAPCAGCATRDLQIADLNEQIADLTAAIEEMTANRPLTEREQTIQTAITQVPKEVWNRASGGRPAMPILADIAKITGFPVKAEEVVTLLPKE